MQIFLYFCSVKKIFCIFFLLCALVFMGNNVIYKFHWTGEDYEAYCTDEDSFIYDWINE
jgi:hypothetical protein